MTKGPYCFGFNLVFWCRNFKWVAFSWTFSPIQYWAGGVCPALSLMALTAVFLKCSISLTCLLASSFDDSSFLNGARHRLNPTSAWFREHWVVWLTWLLWTAVVIGNQVLPCSGSAIVTIRRYYSIHWFFRSESPLVWGWNAVDRFCLTLRTFARAWPKCNVNCGSLLLMILVGSPYQG